jgi:hypothetical protein
MNKITMKHERKAFENSIMKNFSNRMINLNSITADVHLI